MEREKLLLLTIRKEMAEVYLRELEYIFGSLLELTAYSTELGETSDILQEAAAQADVILVTSSSLYRYVRPYMTERCRIILLRFGLLRERVEHLRSYPKGTSALVCFSFYQTATQVVSMLHEYGLDNLELKAYNKSDLPSGAQWDLLLVDPNTPVTPIQAGRVVSLGKRKLSLSTLLSIAGTTDILTDEMEERLYAYCSDIYSEDRSPERFYDIFSVNKVQMKAIMDRIDYAILICDRDYRIIDFNQSVKSLFQIHQNINRMYLTQLPELSALLPKIMAEMPPQDEMVEAGPGKNVLISRLDSPALARGREYHIILIKDVSDILALEQSLKKQFSKRGHIAKYDFSSIIGKSPAMVKCIDQAQSIARLDKTTLIIGESGTGKELFASAIHNASQRRAFPFLALNCAALPMALLESELFGYSDGAFTGAKKGGHVGLFEQVNYGTFFLDEIGEISLETQAKLLRVLEEHEIMRVGDSKIIPIDVRVIAATNRNLRELVQKGQFRMDLYYRLNTVELHIPPLRDRREDIPLLIRHILESEKLSHIEVAKEAMDFFLCFDWPGNVRELRNCITYMASVCDGIITTDEIPNYILEEWSEVTGTTPPAPPTSLMQSTSSDPFIPMEDEDRALALAVLKAAAAKHMGRSPLQRLLAEQDIFVSDYRLRQICALLKRYELLHIGKGRRGIQITRKGLELLEYSC